MAEQLQLRRQWRLLKILSVSRHGVSLKEIAAEMEVSEKTVRRDLETFQSVGFPLIEILGESGRKKWRLEPDQSGPGLAFAFDEAIALYLGRRFLEPLAGTLFWQAARRAFEKIRATLPPEALKYIERFSSTFHHTARGVGDYSKKADLIDQISIGIEDRRAVFIAYQSLASTEPTTYDVYPYGIIYHRGALYMVGRKPDQEEICHWKVNRIEEAELTPIHFQMPENFDLERHLSSSFGIYRGDGDLCIKVRFSPTVSRYVSEAKWHESQELFPQKAGSLVAHFQLSDTIEIQRWLLSFGRHAVVLEPAELRDEIIAEFEAGLAAYAASTKAASA